MEEKQVGEYVVVIKRFVCGNGKERFEHHGKGEGLHLLSVIGCLNNHIHALNTASENRGMVVSGVK